MDWIYIVLNGYPRSLAECPPGLFLCGKTLGLKTEYITDGGDIEVYVAESGEVFWGGVKTRKERLELMVMPVSFVWDEAK